MGSGTPLLNDYKREFVWKRFPQTVLGGPKLRLGYDAPAYVYINQVILFVIPWLVGGIFTSFAHYQILQDYIAAIICGTVAVIYVLIVQIIATVAQRKKSSVQPAATNTPNILAEDDEIAFSSCVAIETIEFVAPAKKFKVNIVLHALLSGPVCGLAMLYLLPNTLGALYSNTAATVILFIFGWITVCIAQYSLTVGAPPETATFRALDTWEIAPLSRPFYILVFAAFDLLARYYSEFVPVNYALHIVFIFLPLFWTIGLLPPLDALFLWLLEQALVILYGGSPMATDLRLIVMIILSTGVYLAAYFVPQGLGTIIIISCCGYLLSIDLGGFGAQLFDLCAKKTKEEPGNKNTGFLWKWAVKEVLFHIVMLCLAVGIATVIYYFAAQIGASMADYIAYGIMGLLVLEVLLAEMQTVYVFFGLLRNMLYPSSVQRTTIFKKGKRRLRALGYIRRVIMDWLAPLVMLVYLSLSISPTFSSSSSTTSSFNTTSTAASMLGWTRAFRWVWQSTQNSLLEITVIQIVKLAVSSPVAGWQSLGVGFQLLIVSLCRDRFRDLLNKLYLFFITLITSWSDKKQRRGSTIPTIVVTIILFPVVFGVIGVAVALSAPLLPLFTLPVFLIGYPRPLRSWPHAVGASANACEDTVFYKHAAPELARLLREGYSTGSLGEPAPGKQYLMRFQDRMAWVLVLERGYCYCTISIKGLELQETSCHTVEATRIEDFFEITFEVENGVKCCQFTKYPGNTLRPYDAGLIKTYSDAKNVLTGIIDSPDSLEKVASSFVQSLTWLLLRHCAQVKKSSSMLTSTSSSKQNFQHQELKNMSPSHIGTKETALDNDEDQQTWETMSIRPSSPNSVLQVKPAQRTLSVRSIPTSVWSEDNESLLMEPMDKKETDKINLVAGFASRHMNAKKSTSPSDDQHTVTVMSGVTDSTVTKLSDKDDLFEDLDLGLPAVDLSQKNQANQWTQPNPLFSHPKTVNNTAEKLFTELGGTVDLRSPHSSKLSLPLKWREIPVHPEVLNPLVGQFSKEWYQHVLTVLDLGTEADKVAEVLGNITQDEVLLDIYTRLVMACYAVVNVLGHSSTDVVSLGPSHVYKVYTGDIPWSTASEWITEDSELKEIVIKAYRYAVKLTIDQMLLGDASDHEELQQYLQEYDTEWYIGSEKDKDWTQAVLHGKPSLFSMGHDTVKSTYSSRTLTCQDVETFVGTLNPEAVRGQWANLSVELLYMTNDDEERYSIQAHPTLLRNLTVQSADPPLGYPIFASKPISIPTL